MLRLLVCTFLAVLGFTSASAANVPPEAIAPAPTPILQAGGGYEVLDLKTVFRDPDVTGSAVRMSVRLAAVTKTFDIALYDQAKPISSANFLSYVNGGRYANNFIHRSIPGFVIQGGGFAWTTRGVIEVPTSPTIQNEPGISNLRGTVAMAKLGGDPNSATSQWFVNLADNSANLDGQNGGFTVFGRVVGNGMTVVDEIAALPTYNAGSPFDNLPLKDYISGSVQRVHTVETNAAVIPTLSFQATSNNPELVTVDVGGSNLVITPAVNQHGIATVTVTATDLDGEATSTTLTVHVLPKSFSWAVTDGPDGEPSTLTFSPGDGTLPPAVPVAFGEIAAGSPKTRSLAVANNGASPVKGIVIQATGPNAADFQVPNGEAPRDLPPGGSFDFDVTFTPASHGERSATLRVLSSDVGGEMLNITLSGQGIDITPPVVSQPAPQTLVADARRAAEVPDWRGTLVTATDNAAISSFIQTPAPGSRQSIGNYALVFTAMDATGNTTSVQTTLTVRYDDETLPALAVAKAQGGAALPSNAASAFAEGSFMSAFGTPAISDERSLTSRITVTSGRAKLSAIYFEEESGANRIVAYQGQDTEITGAKFKSFRDPLISHDGAVAFAATLAGMPATENEGVWTDRFGDLQLVLRKGADIPGVDAGLKLKSVTSLSLDDEALLALVKIQPARAIVTAANDTALVRITGPNSGKQLARTGELFDQVKIKQISVLQPAARSVGQGRWTNGTDILVKLTLVTKATVIARIASNGTPTALLRTGTPYENLGYAFVSLGLPSIGGQGITLFGARLAERGVVTAANDGMILHAGDGVNFGPIASEELGLGKFVSFSDPVTNDQGEILSYGVRRAAEAKKPNITALWSWSGAGAPAVVAQLGETATNAEGQPLENAAWSAFPSFALPNGPGAGPIFVGQLAGKGVNGGSKLGLWAVDSGGAVRLLLRTGQEIQTQTETKRVASFALLNSLPGSFGAQRSYNSTGAVAVQVTFSDRSQAIARLDVP